MSGSGLVRILCGLNGSAMMLPRAIGPSGRKVKFGARKYVLTSAIAIGFYRMKWMKLV